MDATSSEFVLTRSPTWSKAELDGFGRKIKYGAAVDADFYNELALWQDAYLQNLVSICHPAVTAAVNTLGDSFTGVHEGERTLNYASRVKSLDTLRSKLITLNTSLSGVDDVAGIRFTIDCDLGDQSVLVVRLCETLRLLDNVRVVIRDLRPSAHSGYRAVHLSVRAPAGRAEIQIRTLLQHAWANLYETFADIAGRQVRYGEAASGEHRATQNTLLQLGDSVFEFERERSDTVHTMRETREIALTTFPVDFDRLEFNEQEGRSQLRKLTKNARHLRDSLEDLRMSLLDENGRGTHV